MRIWKVVTLLLILTMAGACSTPDGETVTEETPADSNAPATADSAPDKPKAEAPKAAANFERAPLVFHTVAFRR